MATMEARAENADIGYDDAPIALIFADSEERRLRAGEAVSAMGGRVAASMAVAGAPERLAEQVAAAMVLVEVGDAPGAPFERLLDRIEEAAEARRFTSVVSIPPALIDLAAARAGHPGVTLLCDPSPMERTVAIGAALSRERARVWAHDAKSSAVLPHLQQLSEEVGRIANRLAMLSGSESTPRFRGLSDAAPSGATAAGAVDEPRVDAAQIRAMIRARRLREQFFGAELFADPAWDMLLDLMAARLERRQVAVSSLCIAAAVPPTTALRWIKTLTDQGLFMRVADPHDGRRVFIALSDAAAQEMQAYLVAVQRIAGAGGHA